MPDAFPDACQRIIRSVNLQVKLRARGCLFERETEDALALCDMRLELQNGDIRMSREARRHGMHLRAFPFVRH